MSEVIRTYLLLTYSLEQSFLRVQQFSAFYGTTRFITAFTCARHLSRSEKRVHVSWQSHFLRLGFVRTSLNAKAGRPHLVCCPQLFIQYIRNYPLYWRPFHHPKPEDAPCCGDRDPLITRLRVHSSNFNFCSFMLCISHELLIFIYRSYRPTKTKIVNLTHVYTSYILYLPSFGETCCPHL
jgi:hypothetical protein